MTAEARSATAQPGPVRYASRGLRALTRTGADPVRADPAVTDLVTRARRDDKRAWDALVERYVPLIWSICRRHRLGDTDAENVGQSVWLQLVDQLDKIRDPAALPGWLVTTTRRECFRVLHAARGPLTAGYVLDAEILPDVQAGTPEQELLAAERHAALREAFTHLPPDGQRLIALLIEDPRVSYAQISARLGIPASASGRIKRPAGIPVPGRMTCRSGRRRAHVLGHEAVALGRIIETYLVSAPGSRHQANA